MSLFNIFKGGAITHVLNTLTNQAGTTANNVANATPGGIGGLIGAGALGAILGRNMSGNTMQNIALLGAGAVAWNFYQKWANNKKAATETENITNSTPQASTSPDDVSIPLDATSKLIIRAMVYAARADGNIDTTERNRMSTIIGQMIPGQDVSSIINQFEQETLNPVTLSKEITNPEQGEDVYRLSCMVIDIDHFMERGYLDELGKNLGLTPELMSKLESEAKEAKQQLNQTNMA